uniref:Beta-defensin n=1 Tax=Prolemur simus TaxID=1328070 RepID=A0A8C8YSY5_PROSS
MKSLFFTFAVFFLLARLVSGNFYVRKCANKTGNCRSTCRTGEMELEPPSGMCPKQKLCCILANKYGKDCVEVKTTETPEEIYRATIASIITYLPPIITLKTKTDKAHRAPYPMTPMKL